MFLFYRYNEQPLIYSQNLVYSVYQFVKVEKLKLFKVETASCFNNSFLLNLALNSWRFWKLSVVKCAAQRAKLQLQFTT